MPVGAGLSPAGFVPAGYGQVDTALAPNQVPLPDPKTGLSDGGRLINPRTGDYEFTTDGRLVGMPNVQQLVLLAVANIDLSSLAERPPGFLNKLTNLVATAFAPLVQQKLVRLVNVVLPPVGNPDGALAIANWIDLTTGQALPQNIFVTQ